MDVWWKATGTEAQLIAAIKTLGLAPYMLDDDLIIVANHHCAIAQTLDRMAQRPEHDQDGAETKPGVYDGPHLKCRYISPEAVAAVEQVLEEYGEGRKPWPTGIEVSTDVDTVSWA